MKSRSTTLRAAAARVPPKGRTAALAAGFDLPLDTEPMEAKLADELPTGPGWQYEPKWDGFRCLAYKASHEVELRAKSGKDLGRYFPEVRAMLSQVKAERFVIDGELVIEIEGRPAFDALQLRLHPAESRVRKLSREMPARLVAFDMLAAPGGSILVDRPLTERRRRLEAFIKRVGVPKGLEISPVTQDLSVAQQWLTQSGSATDGVVAKRLHGAYAAGERSMIKVKRLRTADCVVGGFRYARDGSGVGTLLLGLYDDNGRLDHVGFTSTITDEERPALTRRLEALRAAPGFTGASPGGPSRWSTERSGEWEPVRPKLVVEVRFDQVTGRRFRHGTRLLRWRPDKAPRQCTFAQIEPTAALT